MATAEPHTSAQPATARRGRASRVLVWAGPVVAALGGLAWYAFTGRYVTTDNAYVKADVIAIAPRVAGTVASVSVESDAMVDAGQVLVRLDDTEARLSVSRAEAELAAEINEIESLRLQISAAEARIQSARARLDYRQREALRIEGLAAQGIASRVGYDAAVEDARVARDATLIAEREMRELVARLGGDPAAPAAANPRVMLRQAALEQARVSLGYAIIQAPRSAQAGVVEIFPGEQVKAGERILSLVGTNAPWLEANLKETQVGRLVVGQPARVEFDAYPGIEWRARVSSLGPATGAEFALLPPENASGNWVKIVQRVPVRLDFETDNPILALRAGMSAELSIDTGEGNRRFRRFLSDRSGIAGPR
jgi:membrane fusion protein (multidrug efflux system)